MAKKKGFSIFGFQGEQDPEDYKKDVEAEIDDEIVAIDIGQLLSPGFELPINAWAQLVLGKKGIYLNRFFGAYTTENLLRVTAKKPKPKKSGFFLPFASIKKVEHFKPKSIFRRLFFGEQEFNLFEALPGAPYFRFEGNLRRDAVANEGDILRIVLCGKPLEFHELVEKARTESIV